MKDFLYVIYSPKRKQVKIGRTINPKTRLGEIRIHVKDKQCQYIALCVTKDSKIILNNASAIEKAIYKSITGDIDWAITNLQSIEKKLHILFSNYNQITHKKYGEWFEEKIIGDLFYALNEIPEFDKIYIDGQKNNDFTLVDSWYFFDDLFRFSTKKYYKEKEEFFQK